jgi:5-methylcytosine-specific restriction protein A
MRNRVHKPGYMVRQPRALAEQAEREARQKGSDVAHRMYQTKQWKILRAQVLREQPYCVCGCGGKADTVDHIQNHDGNPLLFYDRQNLQAMTRACHNKKTNQYDGGFGRERKQYKPAKTDKPKAPKEEDDGYFIV